MSDGFTANLLIARLSVADRAAVRGLTTTVHFELGETLTEPGDPILHLHFVLDGIISAVGEMADGRSIETFMVGFEGLSGIAAAVVPSSTFSRHVVQAAGSALRVDADRFRALAADRPELRAVLAAYGSGLFGELEQSSACNALHRAEQRLAKWLLRCHDRVGGDDIRLTQEYLAALLGAQRTTVNEAAQGLQKSGAIIYSRGRVTVLDRGALEQAACECYRGGAHIHAA